LTIPSGWYILHLNKAPLGANHKTKNKENTMSTINTKPDDLYLYDSETHEMVSADDLGITAAEYVAACRESTEAAPEAYVYVMVAGRRVYACE